MSLTLPIDLDGLTEHYPSLAQILSQVERIHMRFAHETDATRTIAEMSIGCEALEIRFTALPGPEPAGGGEAMPGNGEGDAMWLAW